MSLSSEEFTAALAKGSGRAMILLCQSPDRKEFQEQLFAACVHNVTYDIQCEHERSRYLADLVLATGEQRSFFARLLAILAAQPGDEEERPDLLQIFAVLARLAAADPDLDAEALRQAYARIADEDDRLALLESLVRLDGRPAFLRGVEELDDDLKERWWWIDGLIEALRDHEGPGFDVAELRTANDALDRLMTYAEAQRSRPQEEHPYDFDEIRASLRRGVRPQNPWDWLRRLTDTEWRLLAEDLAAETEEKKAAIYLRLFARRTFPGDLAPLFRWAEEPSGQSASFPAIMALGRIRFPTVRALALKMIEAGETHGARLLRSNFEPGDFARLAHLLDALVDINAIHDFGLSLLDIVSKQERPPDAGDILLRLYERTPCSMCRNDVVTALSSLDMVPPWMAEECRFDAEPETVKLFAKPDELGSTTRP
jgi:hypothetical protein